AVGAQYERSMMIDGFQQWVQLLVRTLVVLPHPCFGQWERFGEITFWPAVAPVLRQASEFDHAVVRRSCGRAIGDFGDECAVRLGQDDALLLLEGVDCFPPQRCTVLEGTAEYRQVVKSGSVGIHEAESYHRLRHHQTRDGHRLTVE